MAIMEQDGYIGSISYDDEQDIFHGRIINTRDVITFEGRSVEELREALADSIEDYRAMCAEDGVEPEKPFSGKFQLRLDPELHREVAVAAARANKTMNAFIKEAISEHIAEVR